jgi:hypothetical protein
MSNDEPEPTRPSEAAQQSALILGCRARVIALEAELADMTKQRDTLLVPTIGHRKPCYYCNEPCNDLAGNPSRWSIPLCHADDPGRVKYHHVGCVSERLAQRDEARALLGMDQPWPLRDAVAKLVGAVDHLLTDHLCDGHGYEEVIAARDVCLAFLAATEPKEPTT